MPEDNENMEKSFAEHNKIVNPSDSIITGQKFSQEKIKLILLLYQIKIYSIKAIKI